MNAYPTLAPGELFAGHIAARPLVLPAAHLENGRLVFASLTEQQQALRTGAFMLRYPDGFDPMPAVKLAREFNLPAQTVDAGSRAYRGYRAHPDICFARTAYHMEQLIISREVREQLFPAALLAVTRMMDETSAAVLRSVLALCGVAEADWTFLTGGAAANAGTHWFVANKYDAPVHGLSGCSAHQDTGFVTVLFIDQPGLEGFFGDEWRSIDPVPGHFVVNFGLALQILTQRCVLPVAALMHRVRLPPGGDGQGRISFAAFASAPTHGQLYALHEDGTAELRHQVDDFLRAHDLETWREDA